MKTMNTMERIRTIKEFDQDPIKKEFVYNNFFQINIFLTLYTIDKILFFYRGKCTFISFFPSVRINQSHDDKKNKTAQKR